MNPEIENLINMALADGAVSEKERAIILRKAESLGFDKDEVEMILDGRIALLKKEQIPTSQSISPKSNKDGSIKKCPSCGATAQAFATKCSDCGHEFRNIQAANSVKELSTQLQNAADRIRKEKENIKVNSTNAHLKHPNNVAKEIATLQESIISSFPVPNTKEDILEFLSIALPEAKKKPNSIGGYVFDGSDGLKNAWLAKCEQVIMKAKFSIKDDKKLQEEIEYYASQIGMHQQQNNRGCLGFILGPFIKTIQGGK
jgi:hypothetical protein